MDFVGKLITIEPDLEDFAGDLAEATFEELEEWRAKQNAFQAYLEETGQL